MKRYIKGLFVILVIVMSLVAVQSVCAETVTGTIEEISTEKPSNMIVVGETEVYGMRIKYLANQYNIVLAVGDMVNIDVYEVLCSDGTIKLMACKITVDDVTVALRDCQ